MFMNVDLSLAWPALVAAFIGALLGGVLVRRSSAPTAQAVSAPVAPLPAAGASPGLYVEDGISDEVVAVIAAAVAAMDNTGNLVLRSVRSSSARSGGRSPWAAAGIEQNLRGLS